MNKNELKISRRAMLAATGSTLLLGGSLCGCRTAPVTGRPQLLLMPESQELTLGQTAFSETLQSEPLSQNSRYVDIVKRVGDRIANVAARDDFEWEFKLLASPTQNAFCLPGGKVAIYEGILPVCQNEAGLAVVMSHEIAHALARHGGERMTHEMVSQSGQKIASMLSKKHLPEKHEMLMHAYGLGSKYGVLLPYNRKQESEADHIGVTLMAKAGYSPKEAPKFWQRFASVKDGDKQPEFMSTHPSDQRRAADLIKLMTDASDLYNAAPTKHGLGERFA